MRCARQQPIRFWLWKQRLAMILWWKYDLRPLRNARQYVATAADYFDNGFSPLGAAAEDATYWEPD